MRITWFAFMTFRIQIAGRIIVTHPQAAPAGVDRTELVAGAQTVVPSQGAALADFDPSAWRPRRRVRLIDSEGEMDALGLYRLGADGLVADSADEGLLTIAQADAAQQWNRWADNGIVVISGTGASCFAQTAALLDAARPRLIALAVTDGDIEAAFEALAPHLGETSLLVLEAGMAVEV